MRGARLASTLLLACLTLVACEDDPVGPVDPSPPTSTATTTPTPTGPTPPPLPEEAKAGTDAGAIAFTKHYIDLLNVASATGDVAALRAEASNCKGCETYANLYEKTYADGGYYRGFIWTPIGPIADTKGQPAVVVVDVNTAETRFRLSKSAKEEVGPKSTYKLRFELDRTSGAWTMTEMALQPVGADE